MVALLALVKDVRYDSNLGKIVSVVPSKTTAYSVKIPDVTKLTSKTGVGII